MLYSSSLPFFFSSLLQRNWKRNAPIFSKRPILYGTRWLKIFYVVRCVCHWNGKLTKNARIIIIWIHAFFILRMPNNNEFRNRKWAANAHRQSKWCTMKNAGVIFVATANSTLSQATPHCKKNWLLFASASLLSLLLFRYNSRFRFFRATFQKQSHQENITQFAY